MSIYIHTYIHWRIWWVRVATHPIADAIIQETSVDTTPWTGRRRDALEAIGFVSCSIILMDRESSSGCCYIVSTNPFLDAGLAGTRPWTQAVIIFTRTCIDRWLELILRDDRRWIFAEKHFESIRSVRFMRRSTPWLSSVCNFRQSDLLCCRFIKEREITLC